MRVYVATILARPHNLVVRGRMIALAEMDTVGEHVLVDAPDEADAILFVDLQQHPGDPYLRALRRHPLVRSFRNKVFVLDERDRPFFTYPGVYVSGSGRSARANAMRGAPDSSLPNAPAPAETEPDLLFSFLGSRTHPVREALLGLQHPRSIIVDTGNTNFLPWLAPDEPDARRAGLVRYAETLQRSKFVLCPRGHGPSSFRLYETLSAGRVPVIISDTWLAPSGVDWSTCSLRVSERNAASVPDIIESQEAAWPVLAAGARAVWSENFSEGRRWNFYIDQIADVSGSPRPQTPWWAQRQVGRLVAGRFRNAARHRLGAGHEARA